MTDFKDVDADALSPVGKIKLEEASDGYTIYKEFEQMLKGDPVSYTHLDVYKRQVMSYQGTVNRIKQHPIGNRKLKTVTADQMCIRDSHPFPSRTRKLSPVVPKILGWRRPGKIGNCRHLKASTQ